MPAAAALDGMGLALPLQGAVSDVGISVPEAKVLALMGVKRASGSRLERHLALVRAAAERGAALLQPATAYALVPVAPPEAGQADSLELAADPPARLHGRLPALRLGGCQAVLCLVSTIGPEIDRVAAQLMAAGEFPDSFALESYGVAAVNSAMASATRELRARLRAAGWSTTAPVMPGFRDWNVADQATLARLARCEEIGVRVTEGGMLEPLKSKSAVIGVHRTGSASSAVTSKLA